MTIHQLYHIPQKKSSKSRKFFARLLKYFFASGKLGLYHIHSEKTIHTLLAGETKNYKGKE